MCRTIHSYLEELQTHMCIQLHACVHVYTHTHCAYQKYTCIEIDRARKREGERERKSDGHDE